MTLGNFMRLVFVLPLALAGCNDSSGDSPTPPSAPPNLTGVWVGPISVLSQGGGLGAECYPVYPSFGDFRPQTARMELVQTGTQLTGIVFSDGRELYRFTGTVNPIGARAQIPVTATAAPSQVRMYCAAETFLLARMPERSGGTLFYETSGHIAGDLFMGHRSSTIQVDIVARFSNLTRQ